jgi:hypothetical protein
MFYQQVSAIYSYMAQKKQNVLLYNSKEKCILFQDFINGKAKTMKIKLKKRPITENYLRQLKYAYMEQQNVEL